MLISNRFVRAYLFGSKVARVHNKSFDCCVSTAKEGLFQNLSTIILEPKLGNTVGAEPTGLRPCGRVIYSPTLRKNDRFQFHDVIAKTLDAFGEEGCSLEKALEQMFADLKRRGIAVETINLAADQGQADAQRNLGGLYVNSESVQQSDTQMVALYRKAAEQGDAEAQYSLACLYERGRGVPEDNAQAVFWNRKAAEQGYVRAQHMLGYMYRYGLGVPEDYAEACFWFDLAVTGRLDASLTEIATKNREEAASHLTSVELGRVQERARKWFEAHQAKPQ